MVFKILELFLIYGKKGFNHTRDPVLILRNFYCFEKKNIFLYNKNFVKSHRTFFEYYLEMRGEFRTSVSRRASSRVFKFYPWVHACTLFDFISKILSQIESTTQEFNSPNISNTKYYKCFKFSLPSCTFFFIFQIHLWKWFYFEIHDIQQMFS